MIEHRFSHAATTYDRHAQPQMALALRLLQALPDLMPHRILEIGAGTGLLTRLLLDRFAGTHVDALDSAPGMVQFGRARFCDVSRVTWFLGDAGHFDTGSVYSLVISNAALQWVEDLPAVLRHLSGRLDRGGCLAIGIMLSRTLEELHAIRHEIAPHKSGTFQLPVWETVVAAVRQTGLAVIEQDRALEGMTYASAREFLRILHEQGVTGGHRWPGFQPLTRGELQQLVRTYQERHACAGGIAATYEYGVIIARRTD